MQTKNVAVQRFGQPRFFYTFSTIRIIKSPKILVKNSIKYVTAKNNMAGINPKLKNIISFKSPLFLYKIYNITITVSSRIVYANKSKNPIFPFICKLLLQGY